jgi:hypothetical protein
LNAKRASLDDTNLIKEECPDFETGKFSKWERRQIESRWRQIVGELKIKDHIKCLADFNLTKKASTYCVILFLYKRFLTALYLVILIAISSAWIC